MLLGEVGRIREERRALQHEIGELLCIKSKYGPEGEFELPIQVGDHLVTHA